MSLSYTNFIACHSFPKISNYLAFLLGSFLMQVQNLVFEMSLPPIVVPILRLRTLHWLGDYIFTKNSFQFPIRSQGYFFEYSSFRTLLNTVWLFIILCCLAIFYLMTSVIQSKARLLIFLKIVLIFLQYCNNGLVFTSRRLLFIRGCVDIKGEKTMSSDLFCQRYSICRNTCSDLKIYYCRVLKFHK